MPPWTTSPLGSTDPTVLNPIHSRIMDLYGCHLWWKLWYPQGTYLLLPSHRGEWKIQNREGSTNQSIQSRTHRQDSQGTPWWEISHRTFVKVIRIHIHNLKNSKKKVEIIASACFVSSGWFSQRFPSPNTLSSVPLHSRRTLWISNYIEKIILILHLGKYYKVFCWFPSIRQQVC